MTVIQIPEPLADLPVAAQLEPKWFAEQNLVAVSATGSGKTMVLPAAEAAMRGGVVLCRQPTRMTCASIVPYLRQCWPINVGISTRDDKSGLDGADLVIYSDGSLAGLLERHGDAVKAVYFDEAHVLSEGAEIELGLCKKKGIPIRLLSATIDPSAFCDYLGGAPSVELTGRTFPIVRDFQVEPEDLLSRHDHGSLKAFIRDVAETLAAQGTGGLVFLPTRALCHTAAQAAADIIPARTCHGGDNPGDVNKWMDEQGGPWLLCATVAAATGVTLDIDDVWICDEEIVGEESFGMQRTRAQPLSDNTLLQMAGRVGRKREGIAHLVVPNKNGRPIKGREWLSAQHGYYRQPVAPRPITPPCEQVTPYSVLVQSAKVGIRRDDIDLLSTLDDAELDHAEEWLWRHGVIHGGELTKLGKRIAAFPMSPRQAHLVLTAPSKELQLALAAALPLASTYGLVNIKPGSNAAFKASMQPGWDIWPRDCTVWGNVPLSLAKTLVAFAERGRDWALANNLNPRPFYGALKDFKAAGAHIDKEPVETLSAAALDGLRDECWEHLRRHSLFKEMRFSRGKALPRQPFSPFDSVFATLWALEDRVIEDRIVGIKRQQATRTGGFFYPIDLGVFSPRSRP